MVDPRTPLNLRRTADTTANPNSIFLEWDHYYTVEDEVAGSVTDTSGPAITFLIYFSITSAATLDCPTTYRYHLYSYGFCMENLADATAIVANGGVADCAAAG